MKKIFFLIIVFIFSTAFFFKSDLEECADTDERTVVLLGKKFIKQSLKKKMRDDIYANLYEYCVNEKKRNPEVFKAKYD
ncbi:hypothetical protein OAI92_02935 [Candidatus Pelagibacter sp.]|nr:hypothetical protein [Candidatus Pelagibacter sp.]